MKYTKRILAFLLAICMVVTSVQLPVSAEETYAVETLAEDSETDALIEEDLTTDATVKEDLSEEEIVLEESEEEDTEAEDTIAEESEEEDTEAEDTIAEESEEEVSVVEETVLEETEEESAVEETVIEESAEMEEIETVSDEQETVSYATAKAAVTEKEVVDAAIIFTDLHTNKNNYKDGTIQEIFGTLKGTGLPFSSVTSGGDAFSVNEDSGKYDGYTKTISTSIRNALGISDIPVNYVWSDHDRYAYQENNTTLLDKTSHVAYGLGADGELGTADDGEYYVYALSHGDLSTNDRYGAGFVSDRVSKGFTETVEKAIDNFEADAEKMHKDRPLFIVSHQPLFANRGDNGHAAVWCEAINNVAEKMDVAFFFGHNHNYDKANDYYYAKGSQMPVAQANNDKNGTNTEIKFTHMCAGYMEPSSTNSTSGTTRQGTVIVATIYEDSVNYVTYNKTSKFTGTYSVDVTIDREFADTPGNSGGNTDSDDSDDSDDQPSGTVQNVVNTETKTTVSAAGITALTVTKSSVNPNPKMYKAYAKYDINPEGYTDGTEATVSIELDNSFSQNGEVIVFDVKNQTSSVQNVVNRVVTFTTNHFSEYDVAEVAEGTVLTATGTLADAEAVRITKKEELVDGQAYVLVSNTGKGTLTNSVSNYGYYNAQYRFDLVDNTVITHQWYYEGGGFYYRNSNNDKQWLSITHEGAAIKSSRDNDVVSSVTESTEFGTQNTVADTFVLSTPKGVYLNKYGGVNDGNGGGAHGYRDRDANSNWQIYKVVKPQVTLSVTPSAITLTSIGATFNLASNVGVIVDNETASRSTISYSSNDTSVVTVSNNGVVTAQKQGTATITVTLSQVNGKNLESSISVDVPVTVATIAKIELDNAEGTVACNSPGSTKTGSKLVITYQNGTKETIDVTLDMLTSSGSSVDVSQAGEFSGLTVNYGGITIQNYTLNVIDVYDIEITDSNTKEEIVKTIIVKNVEPGKTQDLDYSLTKNNGVLTADPAKITWTTSDSTIATVDENGLVSFTGEEGVVRVTVVYEYGTDETVSDSVTISVSKGSYIVPEDGTDDFPEYPNEGSVRFDKTATAVGNFSKTGIAKVELSMTGVPYTKNNRLDVVLMLDRSSSMYKEGVQHRISSTVEATKAFVENIVKNEDGSFNNNRIMVMDFLGGNLASGNQHKYESNLYTTKEENGYQVINNQAELDALLNRIQTNFKGQTSLYGTEYAQGLEDCYDALKASKDDGNKQFCVFMSDGIPNYMMGEKTHFTTTDAIVGTFNVTNYNNANASAARGANYEYEKYSTQMKNEGVTVFTVGLGLKNTNSAWNYASKEACEQVANMLLNDISGPAGETGAQRDTGSAVSKLDTYFFSVADDNAAADMKNVFSGISQKILDAAVDVVVEDKIGDEYSVNFAFPTNVTAQLTDGINEFYIQAVEYQLDSNKNRTGTPAILEKFTFNSNGSFKSHTVEGAVCNNCNHVTFTDGNITSIKGTYFEYKSDSTGEYLEWKNERLGGTELALQYFVHLDNSSNAVGQEHEVEAGTYHTNEYAKLTYTNYQGNQVQNEFPVPQMTWNGAQVSYVFYLVNGNGEPVNRAGRVVPFAEAVYVTDVHTHSVVWNDLEQATALDAGLLAEDLVPDVYDLYDNDASYGIHVYADENKTNLNSHFAIRGNVADAYNLEKGWTNAETTYVFNNKADEAKYNVTNVYIANDGNDQVTTTTFLCKGEGTVTATISEATNVTSDNFAQKPYYTLTDGKYRLAANYMANVTYYEISAASYTPVNADENQWIPEKGDNTSGGTLINNHVYYLTEDGVVYTIVQETIGNEVREGFDFYNTTVAFAVVWKPQLEPDTVVVDYGLDVEIDVIQNDNMAAGVVGVRTTAPDVTSEGTYERDKANTANSVDLYIDADGDAIKEFKIGTADVENLSTVRVSLDKTNGMQFKDALEFYYEADVNYYNERGLQTASMYSKVTVIPATTIYYEDCFVSYEHGYEATDESASGTPGKWEIVGSENKNATQDEDRPGESKISADLDADNIYGYDSAYTDCKTYSLGSAHKVKLNKKTSGTWPSATFTFTGTGFDIISQTSNTTGTIILNVKNSADEVLYNWVVDTYYGYTATKEGYTKNTFIFGTDGKWHLKSSEVVTTAKEDGVKKETPVVGDTVTVYEDNIVWTPTTGENALYQIPIIKSPKLAYGTYTVTITPRYAAAFDHTGNNSYDFYLDAIRVYSPAGDGSVSTTVHNAYKADGELYPEFIELRNELLEQNAFAVSGLNKNGAVFIDGFGTNGDISDYEKYGPNNEIYLQTGQAVAFILEAANSRLVDREHLGVKSPNGGDVSIRVSALATADGKQKVSKTITTSSASEQYFDVSDCVSWTSTGAAVDGTSDIILIENTGTAMVSLTNLKVTYKEAEATPALLMMNAAAAATAVSYMSARYIGSIETAEKAEVLSVTTDKSSYVLSDTIKASIETNDAAEYVTVNGEMITEYTTEGTTRIWEYDFEVSNDEDNVEFTVIAYNELDEASDAVTKIVKVRKFAPKTLELELDKNKLIVGKKVQAKVTTSDDVEYVTVNGKKITKYTTDTAGALKYWTYEVKATKAGTKTIKVTAYDVNGNASESILKSIKAVKFEPRAFKLELDSDEVNVGEKVQAKVTTCNVVEYVTINGKKVTEYTTNKAKTLRYWTYEVEVTKAGTRKVEAIAYDVKDSVSDVKSAVVTVNKK